ncbi:MAG: hypothetical protein IIX93_04615 [Clostridia bacterium]|nr:hypothetical protein [Clostridia bacterium]
MKRIQFFLTIILLFLALSAFSAFSEECEHVWNYTNNGESGHTAACSLCGQTRSDAHNLLADRKGATCLAPAVTSYSCTVCNYTYSYTEGEKNPGHAWGDYVVVRPATCRQAGIHQRTCPDCGQVETEELAQLEHDYGPWKKHDEKWHIRYCKLCDWAYKGSHRLDDGKIIVKPTDAQLGLIKYTCRVCDETFENILRQDGAIYAIETKDVLGNGTNYLLAASKDEETGVLSQITLSGGSFIDMRPTAESSFSIYANSKTGNYAGLSVDSGETAIDVIPKADFDIVPVEFIKLAKNASAHIRIFNASGALEIANLNGPRVIIAQHKNADGSIITLLMRLTEKRDTVECEAEIHASRGGVIVISNKNGEYVFSLPEGAKKIGSLTYKYQRKNGRITVSFRNQENTYNGITVYILEGIEFLRTAKNIKTAETNVQLTDETGTWRLRATFPSGYTLETPLFYKDGSYAYPTNRYLMDEKALGALMLIDPAPQTQTETADLQMPEITPEAVPAPTQTPVAPAPTAAIKQKPVFKPVPASQAAPLSDETVSLSRDDVRAFSSPDCPEIVVQYASGFFFIHQEDGSETKVTAIKLVEQGASFRIQNAYKMPSEFELGSGTTGVTIKAEIKNAKGKTSEIPLGTYIITP